MADGPDGVVHWGEINEPPAKYTSQGHEISEPKAAEYEIPRLHQPSTDSYLPKDELPVKFLPSVKPPLDRHGQNLVLHSIELQHHKRRMRLVLMAAQHQHGEAMKSEGHEPLSLPPHPPRPTKFCSTHGIVTPQTQSTLMARLHSPPCEPESPPQLVHPHLDGSSVRQLLFRAVAAVCAHSGFEMASESALETLTDILHDFNTRFCKLLRSIVDYEAANGRVGFSDPMDVALHEIGLGGTAAIQKYWTNSIQDYALRLQHEDQLLIHDYKLITDPSTRSGHRGNNATTSVVKMEDDSHESKYSSSALYRTYSTEQSTDFPSISPITNGHAAGASDVTSDPTSPHWNMNYKTEPVDEGYDDPMNVVPATPQPS